MFKHCDICLFVVHVVQHACKGVYFLLCAVCTGIQYDFCGGTIDGLGAIVPVLFTFVATEAL